MSNVFSMGGYGYYVWSAYAITFGVFAFSFLASIREYRRIKKTLTQGGEHES